MEFILTSVSHSEEDLLKEYPKLAEFKFVDCTINNEVRKAIVLKDLDDLMELKEAVGHALIINVFSWNPGEVSYYLDIYDSWIE